MRTYPCVLLIDISSAMSDCEQNLHECLAKFVDRLHKRDYEFRPEMMVILFDDEPHIVWPFTRLSRLEVPGFTCGGSTALFKALDLACDEIRIRQEQYTDAGVDYVHPLLVVLTDGHPQDQDERGVVQRIHNLCENYELTLLLFALGDGEDGDSLKCLQNDCFVFRHVGKNQLENVFDDLARSLFLDEISTLSFGIYNFTLPEGITII